MKIGDKVWTWDHWKNLIEIKIESIEDHDTIDVVNGQFPLSWCSPVREKAKKKLLEHIQNEIQTKNNNIVRLKEICTKLNEERICKYPECHYYDPESKVYCCNACSGDHYDYNKLHKEKEMDDKKLHPVKFSKDQIRFIEHIIYQKGLACWGEESRDILSTIEKSVKEKNSGMSKTAL